MPTLRRLPLLAAFTSALPPLACAPALPADLILRDCAVYTMVTETPAEALAVRDGTIVAVGPTREVKRLIGPETEVVDCREGGWAVLPGFIDAHTHLVWSATELEDVDLWEATTLEELLTPITAQAEAYPDAPWIRGGGWDVSIFDGQLHRSQLDGIVPDRPVYMASADAHSAWLNSRALTEAGITADTLDPEGGEIERDEDGEPTGILRENALALVEAVLPAYPEAQVDTGLTWALEEANAYGLTTLVDAAVEPWMLDGYRRFEQAGRLTVRIHGAVEVLPTNIPGGVAEATELADTYHSDLIQVDQVKLFLDGVIETQTASMIEPYVDGTNGVPLFTDEALRQAFEAADAAGFQIHTHALGDGAVRQSLDALEWLSQARGAADRRPLLAHLEVIDPADVPRFAALGAFADFQLLWAYPDSYIQELTWPVIGPERSEWLYPVQAVVEAGGAVVAGSDWSVSSMNPWEACEVAVTRQDPWEGGDVLTPQHRIDLHRCLRAYTAEAARAVFEESRLGTLEVGKVADLVLVDRDPFAVAAEELSDVTVRRTWLGGKGVYDAGTAERRGRTKGPQASRAGTTHTHHAEVARRGP